MNRIFLFLLLFISFCAQAQIDKLVPKKPAPEAGLVQDYAGILTEEQEQELERKLLAYDDSTSSQIAVVTLPTLIDDRGVEYEDEEVALKILREWGIGQKDRDNGIVVLIVKSQDDKEKKIRIEVGYGLEGAIPDMVAASIIDHEIATNFKTGNFYRGLDEGTSALIKAAAGEYKAPEDYGKKGFKGPKIGTIVFIAILLIFLFSGAAGGGGWGGGYVSRRGYRGWWLPTGGGGGWSGGGGGWSGGGGGGFGGFGGGSGGGGGASGSW